MIDLYTAPTPNGYKVSILLEELKIPYNVISVNLEKKEQKKTEFLKLNPNGRIPIIVDHENNDFTVFESGAILIYLAEKSGKFLSSDPNGRSVTLQWLMFQMSGIGPMQGQAVTFVRYFPEQIPQAIDRYCNESRRLYEVLDNHLADRDYIAGEYSIADIANYSWIRSYYWARVNIEGLDHLRAWMNRMGAKPGILRGCEVPQGAKNSKDLKQGGASITTT